MKLALLLTGMTALAQQAPTHILVAYHSDTGNTAKLARAVRKGAASLPDVEVTLRKTTEVKDDEILKADGIALGTPVHWSNLSAEAKRFLDHTGEVLWKAKTSGDGRTAGAFCTGGGVAMGKDMARLSILSAFLTMRFMVIGGVDADGYGTIGPQATTGPPNKGVSEKDEEEARQFGERFARYTQQFRGSRIRSSANTR